MLQMKIVYTVYTAIIFPFQLQTDATMTELEIDMNMRIGEWSTIQVTLS